MEDGVLFMCNEVTNTTKKITVKKVEKQSALINHHY